MMQAGPEPGWSQNHWTRTIGPRLHPSEGGVLPCTSLSPWRRGLLIQGDMEEAPSVSVMMSLLEGANGRVVMSLLQGAGVGRHCSGSHLSSYLSYHLLNSYWA